MMIPDDELRSIFQAASEEHLQNLDNGLLHLEKHPNDAEVLADLMREAHSLKGDANMLGVKDIGSLAHQIEHILSHLKQHHEPLTAELGDRLAHGLAAIRQLVHEAVTGEPAQTNTFLVLAELMGSDVQAPPTLVPNAVVTSAATNGAANGLSEPSAGLAATETLNATESLEAIASSEPLEPFEPGHSYPRQGGELQPGWMQPDALSANTAHRLIESASAASELASTPRLPLSSDRYRIATIRVPTRHLDQLMTQAGELTVTKIRIAHRLSQIEAIATLWDEWNRDRFNNRFLLDELSKTTVALDKLERFHARTDERFNQLGTLLQSLHNSFYEDTTRLEVLSTDLESGIRTLRLLPLSTIFNLFPRMVRDLSRQQGKQVELVIEGGETQADKRILEDMKDPLMHLLRNAIDHGIELPADRVRLGKPPTATLYLRGYQTPTQVVIEVQDDGRGLNVEQIKHTALRRGIIREEELATLTPEQVQALIFAPGFSTSPLVTEVSGRGVGLDVVHTNVEQLKGSIQVESTPNQGCRFQIQLGLTLATAHVLIVATNHTLYALPVEFVWMACLVSPQELFTIEGRDTIVRHDRPISVVPLSDLLELPTSPRPTYSPVPTQMPCIILQVGQEQLGLLVDRLVDEQDVVIKPQSKLLKRVRNVSGATILGTGEVCMVLNPQDLIKSARRTAVSISPTQAPAAAEKYTVLLVEDSIATRTQEKRILEAGGYEVVTAVDGLDGFNKLQSRHFDAVISDVQMPHLDGLGLTSKIRQYREFNELPIILVTSLASDEDKRRGAEAGANAYITKGSFNQSLLLETLQRLV